MELNLKKFKGVNLRRQEVVAMEPLQEGERLPLVIRPLAEDVDIARWVRDHREPIERHLLTHGALLFRGFGIDSPGEFERFAREICPVLFNENGEHPRESVSGNVYTPVFYPAEQKLLWHNENSFNHAWPSKIMFCCAQPAQEGGATPLVDSRRVYELLSPEIRSVFEDKQIMYMRNYEPGLGLGWQTVFQTDDRDEVERQSAESRVEIEWKPDGSLRTRCIRPAVVRHPASGEMSWFNQAQHWHVSCLDPETRASLQALFSDKELPRNCYYGDGSPISDKVMSAVLGVYASLEVSFPWQRGDILVVENVLTAHARQPFTGVRKILVAMGDMATFDEVAANGSRV
jgi:alpha-ketoglutarate-dependent taurine dioxygenase